MTLVWVVLLVVANGLFVATEFALVASLRSRVEPAADRIAGRMALRSMGNLGTMLAGTQLGVTLASLALGSVVEPTAEHAFAGWFARLDLPDRAVAPAAVVVSLGLVVLAHLVLGEMVPKSLALAAPERTLLTLALPATAFVGLLRPVIWILNRLAATGARILGVEPADELRGSATAAELGAMIEESHTEGLLEGDDHERLVAALGFVERPVDVVMVARSDVVFAPHTATVAEVEALMVRSGLSRILLVGEGVDDVLGFVHVKDILQVPVAERGARVPRSLIRMVLTVRTGCGLGHVLTAMRRARRHVAVVVDARRVTVGLVTIEDLLETLVGDIVDETDRPDPRGAIR
ncbi:MAG: hemolysin family protein [Microthrixaceae bacterium]